MHEEEEKRRKKRREGGVEPMGLLPKPEASITELSEENFLVDQQLI